MLKDITLGQYFPGDTVAHRLDPRTKILLTTLYIVALFSAGGVLTYAVMAVCLIAAVRVAHVPPRAMVRGLRPVLFILIFTAVLNLFFTPGEREFFRFGFLAVTDTGIKTAVFMVLRIMLLIMGTFLMTYTTSPISLTDALESLLNGLKRFRVPVHELSMMMSIALRFIPTLIEETDKIMSAQKARGADLEGGNVVQRAKAMIPILVPLFSGAPTSWPPPWSAAVTTAARGGRACTSCDTSGGIMRLWQWAAQSALRCLCWGVLGCELRERRGRQ